MIKKTVRLCAVIGGTVVLLLFFLAHKTKAEINSQVGKIDAAGILEEVSRKRAAIRSLETDFLFGGPSNSQNTLHLLYKKPYKVHITGFKVTTTGDEVEVIFVKNKDQNLILSQIECSDEKIKAYLVFKKEQSQFESRLTLNEVLEQNQFKYCGIAIKHDTKDDIVILTNEIPVTTPDVTFGAILRETDPPDVNYGAILRETEFLTQYWQRGIELFLLNLCPRNVLVSGSRVEVEGTEQEKGKQIYILKSTVETKNYEGKSEARILRMWLDIEDQTVFRTELNRFCRDDSTSYTITAVVKQTHEIPEGMELPSCIEIQNTASPTERKILSLRNLTINPQISDERFFIDIGEQEDRLYLGKRGQVN